MELSQPNAPPETLLRTITEISPSAVCILDCAGRLTLWNPAAESIFGWKAEEVLGGRLPMLKPEQRAEIEAQIVAGAGQSAPQGREITGVRKDGILLNLLLWTAPLGDALRPAGLVAIFQDVTERRWMREQLRQAQKMEALGRMAGGIAHDFNNLLTIVSGYAEMLLPQLEGRQREDVQAILEATQSGVALAKQLLTLGRQQVGEPRLVDLNATITAVEKILRRALGDSVVLELSLRPALWYVRADPAGLEQVLLNLALNARDAMPHGGRLIIATANCTRAEAASLHLNGGEYVRLTVRDTGLGMDAEATRRIFEPFFTTKPDDKGTGLGLAIVYNVVKQCGGVIFVDSQPGEGTVFTIYLPRAHGAPEAPRRHASGFSAGGGETILLVEDEEGVRRLVRNMLARQGYRVLEAAGAEEALRLWEQAADRIDLLLTDVVMPGMSGRQLALRLLAARPELKVVYMSGYAGDALGEQGVLAPDVVLIQKPFTPRLLLRRIREALGAQPRRSSSL